MPTVDNLDIQISTSLQNSDKMLDNLIKKLGVVSSSLSSVGGTTSKVSSGMTKVVTSANKSTKSFKGLASAIGSFYANYAFVIRGIKQLNNSIQSTADYVEAFNYFEVSFNKIAREWQHDFSEFGYDNAESYAESFNKRAKETLSKLSGVQIDVDADGKGLLTETGMKNLGLNIQDITQYASQLASVTNSIGQTGEVSLRTSTAFTKLAGDISSLYNVDYSSVATNLQSGLIGQSRALYKYGIDITNATLQTYAYELGLEKAVSEMTQAEKMQLRMIAILDQSKVSWGDLANTINSPSNMIRQFKNNLKEAGLVLGQLFIPLLEKVLPIINGVTIAIKRLLTNIAGFLGIEIDLSSFGQTTSVTDDLSESLNSVSESAEEAKKGIRKFDELKTINTGSSTSDSSLQNTIDLTDEIIAATEEYEKVWQEAYEKMEQKAISFADAIENTFYKIGRSVSNSDMFKSFENIAKNLYETYSTVFGDVWNKVLVPFGEKFSTYLLPTIQEFYEESAKTLDAYYEEVTSVFDNIWEDVSPDLDILSGTWEDVMVSISNAWNEHGKPVFTQIRAAISSIASIVTSVWETTVSPIWKNLTKNFDELWGNHLSPLVDDIFGFVGVFAESALMLYNNFIAPVTMFFQKMFGPQIAQTLNRIVDNLFIVMGVVADVASVILTHLTNVINFITGVFSGDWEKAWNSIANIFKNQFNLILTFLESILNFGINGINRFLNRFSGVSDIISEISGKEIKVPQIERIHIQRYEVGGFPNKASLFWANENGIPELVGTMGGRTAVASGTEITGIKDAIYSTGQQETSLMSTMVGLLKIIAEKEFGITDSEIGKSAQRYARDYFNRTGDEAFSF